MSELQIQFTIDGQEYSREQLERIQYERQLHVLHEMKRLGATIQAGDKILSDGDINFLSADEAGKICITNRAKYDLQGIRVLYKQQLQKSDQMWKELNKDFLVGDPMQSAYTDMKVIGVSLEAFMKTSKDSEMDRMTGFAMNPEHFFLTTSEGEFHGMETFGMYGGPTEVKVTVDPNVKVPIEKDPDYPMVMAGYTSLASDGTKINIIPIHQFKPIENGLLAKLAVFFPSKTPKELVDGHKIHLAVEFLETFKLLADDKGRC